jgi:hypothetical protein
LFFEKGSISSLPRLASNLSPPDLCLLNIKNYRQRHWCPDTIPVLEVRKLRLREKGTGFLQATNPLTLATRPYG